MTSLINFRKLTEFIPNLDSKKRTILYASVANLFMMERLQLM